jgi:glucose-1-phosphate cytidylyltransferase
MNSVILAGGLGTRLREETEFKPKPMVEIGGAPILWHIMKNLSGWDLKDFFICTGYKGEKIKEFFINYEAYSNDIEVSLGSGMSKVKHTSASVENWNVHLIDTGQNTMTGGRLFQLRDKLQDEYFLCTYGDGLSNVNVNELIAFHKSHNKIATVTAVHPTNRFGTLGISSDSTVSKFVEKPISGEYVNGGFFIFNKKVFNYLTEDAVLEQEPLKNLVRDGELMAFKHEKFWQPMDTYREVLELNALWDSKDAPWVNWERQ